MAQTQLNPTTVGAVGRVRGASLCSLPPQSNTTGVHGKEWLEVAASRLRRCHGLTYARALLTAALAGLGGRHE